MDGDPEEPALTFAQLRSRVTSRPPVDAGDPMLVEHIRDEIADRGPITFARFMERALYEPGLGYYAASRERTTRAGDFLTAPELHPVFGHALARQLDEMWRNLEQPATFTLREYGAGRGTLGATIREGLQRMGSALLDHLRYEPLDTGDQAAGSLTGCVLANELIDALPVHRVVMREGSLDELYVDWDGERFVERIGGLSTAALGDWFAEAGIELRDGQRAEACLAMAGWLDEVSGSLERGYVMIIDYGAEPAELYGPSRPNGTLRAFRDHHLGSAVLAGVGRQDLTATVDLAALRRLASDRGLSVLGQTTQAEMLTGGGLEEALAHERERTADSWEGQLTLRSAVMRLLDPRQLGGYAVILLGRGVDDQPALSGLAFRLPSR
jgi:SAM-dependent MidA family methyltransferase